MNYSEKLKDPRWQKKRLEILQRDNFTCQCCMDSNSTLNIHHIYYTKGKQPWDVDNESLLTLCEHCHYIYSNVSDGSIIINRMINCDGDKVKFYYDPMNRTIYFITVKDFAIYKISDSEKYLLIKFFTDILGFIVSDSFFNDAKIDKNYVTT